MTLIIIKKHNVLIKLGQFSSNIGFYLFKDDMVNRIETSFNTKQKSIERFRDKIGWF